jgi:hypothetical protein
MTLRLCPMRERRGPDDINGTLSAAISVMEPRRKRPPFPEMMDDERLLELLKIHPEIIATAHRRDFEQHTALRKNVLSEKEREEHRQFVRELAAGLIDLDEDDLVAIGAAGPIDCQCGFCLHEQFAWRLREFETGGRRARRKRLPLRFGA